MSANIYQQNIDSYLNSYRANFQAPDVLTPEDMEMDYLAESDQDRKEQKRAYLNQVSTWVSSGTAPAETPAAPAAPAGGKSTKTQPTKVQMKVDIPTQKMKDAV